MRSNVGSMHSSNGESEGQSPKFYRIRSGEGILFLVLTLLVSVISLVVGYGHNTQTDIDTRVTRAEERSAKLIGESESRSRALITDLETRITKAFGDLETTLQRQIYQAEQQDQRRFEQIEERAFRKK